MKETLSLFANCSKTVLRLPSKGSGTGSYLVGVKGAEPVLNVDGIPAWNQAAVLESTQLQGSVRPSCDHLVEGVLQGHWVVMGSLVLRARGEGQHVTRRAQRKMLLWDSSHEVARRPWAEIRSPGFKSWLCLALPSHLREVTGPSEPRFPILQDVSWARSAFPNVGHPHTISVISVIATNRRVWCFYKSVCANVNLLFCTLTPLS